MKRADKFCALYYVVLAVITLLLSKLGAEYPSLVRILYFLAVLLPCLWNCKFFPLATIAFMGYSICSFVPLIPSTSLILFAGFIGVALMNYKNLRRQHGEVWFLVAILYYFVGCILSPMENDSFVKSIILIVILYLLLSKPEDLQMVAWGGVLMSLLISLLFLFNFKEFLAAYVLEEGIERASWTNPNLFGGHIACGLILASWLLAYNGKILTKYSSIILIAIIIVDSIVLILNASRGAIFSSVVCVLFFLLFSGQSKKMKFLLVALSVVFIYFINTTDVLQLLTYRVTEMDILGLNDRGGIWTSKLKAFNDMGPSEWIFGIGKGACTKLAVDISTHNDFITSLIAYGLIGCLFFLNIIFLPVRKASKEKRGQIIGLTLFLVLECCVLEPLFRGYYVFLAFYIFIYKLATLKDSETKEVQI